MDLQNCLEALAMPRFKRETRLTKQELVDIWETGEPVTPVETHEDLLRALQPGGVDLWIGAVVGATTYHPDPATKFPNADLADWQSLDARQKHVWHPPLDPATSG